MAKDKKQYVENENGELVCEGKTYPAARFRARIEAEVAASKGSVEIVAFDRDAETARKQRAEKRGKARSTIAALTVTVRKRDFDADDHSITMMLAAVTAAEHRNEATVPRWTLADNSVERNVPVEDMKAAIAAAMDQRDAALFD